MPLICPTIFADTQSQPYKQGRCAPPPCNDCATNPLIHHKILSRRRTCFWRGEVSLRWRVALRLTVFGRRPVGGEHAVFVSLVA